MANPVFVDCPIEVWTKIATNVTAGQIHRVTNAPYEYLQTYVLTGGTAPTLRAEGVPLFEQSAHEAVSASAGIDIYLYPILAAGRVRVDV